MSRYITFNGKKVMGLREESDGAEALPNYMAGSGSIATASGNATGYVPSSGPLSTRAVAPTTRVRMQAVVVSGAAELEAYVSAWEDLAANALEANIFYEPWVFLPALKSFGGSVKLRFVFVFAASRSAQSSPLLCGFFPLECSRSYRGLPSKVLSLWKHAHCFLCTPLVRAGYEGECLKSLFQWLERDSRCGLVEFGSIGADGPFEQALSRMLQEQPRRAAFSSDCYERAMFRPAESADAYLRAAISRSHRKDLSRRRRRLSESGQFECLASGPDDDIEAWIEDFLRLEAGGWKGREGTALASKDSDRAFFASAMREAFKRGRLMMLALKIDGKPIAIKCNFSAGEGAFAFKIAFDESHAHFSPGMLLEIENIKRLHEMREVQWMDSCAVPNHFMINRLWPDRRLIRSVLIATRRGSMSFIVSLLPYLRSISRALRGRGLRRSPDV
jgi:CelD/BcsL family acetyltransferase involved in cellulose biosynthesis